MTSYASSVWDGGYKRVNFGFRERVVLSCTTDSPYCAFSLNEIHFRWNTTSATEQLGRTATSKTTMHFVSVMLGASSCLSRHRRSIPPCPLLSGDWASDFTAPVGAPVGAGRREEKTMPAWCCAWRLESYLHKQAMTLIDRQKRGQWIPDISLLGLPPLLLLTWHSVSPRTSYAGLRGVSFASLIPVSVQSSATASSPPRRPPPPHTHTESSTTTTIPQPSRNPKS